MNIRGLALAALVFVSTPAFAADWVEVTSDGKGGTYSVDRASVRRDGDSITFWIKATFSPPTSDGEDKWTIFRRADCAAQTYVDVKMNFYVGGKLVDSAEGEDTETAKPNTVASNIQAAACAAAPKQRFFS